MTLLGVPVTFCDLLSSKTKQFGFSLPLANGNLVFLGDEPCHPTNAPLLQDAALVIHEAFCLYSERDRFKPYEKNHATVKEAAELAAKYNVSKLLLFHTEDTNLRERKARYTREAKRHFGGGVVVPDDLETIEL